MIEGIVALAVAVGAAFFFGGRYARQNAVKKQQERNAKAHERAKEAGNEIDRMSGDSVAEWLRRRGKQ